MRSLDRVCRRSINTRLLHRLDAAVVSDTACVGFSHFLQKAKQSSLELNSSDVLLGSIISDVSTRNEWAPNPK